MYVCCVSGRRAQCVCVLVRRAEECVTCDVWRVLLLCRGQVDDEMDAQQCGDIDDEDYDNAQVPSLPTFALRVSAFVSGSELLASGSTERVNFWQAAAGDDLALNPDDIQKALYEDVADEVVKEMSDESSDEEMNTHLALDEAGKEMDRIVTGKPVKSKDDKVGASRGLPACARVCHVFSRALASRALSLAHLPLSRTLAALARRLILTVSSRACDACSTRHA